MVVTVFLTLHDEFRAVPRQEDYWMQRLNIFVVLLPVKLSLLFSVVRIVAYETAVVLVAVKLEHI